MPEHCDDAKSSQLWNIESEGPLARISNSAGGKVACWEVRACNYGEGATVDTNFGCKPLPPSGSQDACSNNEAWRINSNRSISSPFSGKCFEISSDGGMLAT